MQAEAIQKEIPSTRLKVRRYIMPSVSELCGPMFKYYRVTAIGVKDDENFW